MGLNCQSFANDCNVNARAFLPAPPGFGICRLNMRSEEKIRGQGRLQSTSTCIGVQTRLRAAAQYDPELIVLREKSQYQQRLGIGRPRQPIRTHRKLKGLLLQWPSHSDGIAGGRRVDDVRLLGAS